MQKLRLEGLQEWPRLPFSVSTTIDESTFPPKGLGMSTGPTRHGFHLSILECFPSCHTKRCKLAGVCLSLSPTPVLRSSSLQIGDLFMKATLRCRSRPAAACMRSSPVQGFCPRSDPDALLSCPAEVVEEAASLMIG